MLEYLSDGAHICVAQGCRPRCGEPDSRFQPDLMADFIRHVTHVTAASKAWHTANHGARSLVDEHESAECGCRQPRYSK